MTAIPMRERRTPEFSATVFAYTDALKVLRASAGPLSAGELAERTDRVTSNVRRDLHKLKDAGVIDFGADAWVTLTDKGRRWLTGVDVAEGAAEEAHGVRSEDTGVILCLPGDLRPNPLNPRKVFDEEEIAALADSIQQAGDVLQNLVVQPPGDDGRRLISAGERRWRAVGLLVERGEWPSLRPLRCIVRPGDPAEVRFLALIENGQREPLTELEEGDAFAAWCEDADITAVEAAQRAGKKPRLVQQRVRVARQATPENRDLFTSGEWNWEQLRHSVEVARPEPPPAPPSSSQPSGGGSDRVDPSRSSAPSEPPRPLQQDTLSPAEWLIVLEVADKVGRQGVDLPGDLWGAPCTGHWLDARLTPLVNERRLIAFFQPQGDDGKGLGWHVRVTERGRDLLEAQNVGDDGVGDAVLSAARNAAGQTAWPASLGYVSRWLNDEAAPPADLPEPEADTLGEAVTAFLGFPPEGGAEAFAKLLAACGVRGALALDTSEGAEGYASQIIDRADGVVAIADPDEGLHPRQAAALARLIAFAVNQAAGLSVIEADDQPTATEEPA